jgi:hypothetical protein
MTNHPIDDGQPMTDPPQTADQVASSGDLVQWALNDLVAHAIAFEKGLSSEDELVGALDQYIVICKLPHFRRNYRAS